MQAERLIISRELQQEHLLAQLEILQAKAEMHIAKRVEVRIIRTSILEAEVALLTEVQILELEHILNQAVVAILLPTEVLELRKVEAEITRLLLIQVLLEQLLHQAAVAETEEVTHRAILPHEVVDHQLEAVVLLAEVAVHQEVVEVQAEVQVLAEAAVEVDNS